MKKTNNNILSGKTRLAQIIGILKKHEVTKGVNPEKFRHILEDLGPTFVKIGQIMSSRQDMFSERYCKELVKLRDNVLPMPIETVRKVIEEEYGKKLEEVFIAFDQRPLGSASIAQVHRATLSDGRCIVAKIQRPNIYETMERDILLVRKASKILHLNEVLGSVVDINIVLDEFWQTAQEEMDFLNEGNYAKRFDALNEDIRYIGVPTIDFEHSTSKVLVMEYIDGYEIDEFDVLEQEGYDRKEIAVKLAENYIKQIVDDGFFHADPHPGNIRIRDGKIIWIDFGMMGTVSQQDKYLLKNAVLAIGSNDTQKLVDVVLALGVHDGRIDYALFYDDMESFMRKYIHLELQDINLGIATQEVFTIAHKYRISMPKGISMLARGLVTIESTMTVLDPTINIVSIAANHVASRAVKKYDLRKEVLKHGKLLQTAVEEGISLPLKLSDIIDIVMKGRLKVNLDIMGSDVPMSSINHMVNKLTVGIVSTGLLMASSLLCTTQMTPKLFGIPALGFFGYISAVILGSWLFYSVLKEHRKRK